MKSISTRVPDDTYERLEERAEERGTSISAEARELIAAGFDADEAGTLATAVERAKEELPSIEEGPHV